MEFPSSIAKNRLAQDWISTESFPPKNQHTNTSIDASHSGIQTIQRTTAARQTVQPDLGYITGLHADKRLRSKHEQCRNGISSVLCGASLSSNLADIFDWLCVLFFVLSSYSLLLLNLCPILRWTCQMLLVSLSSKTCLRTWHEQRALLRTVHLTTRLRVVRVHSWQLSRLSRHRIWSDLIAKNHC